MDESKDTDGSTAMERLCREMAECVVELLPATWCQDHGIYDGEPWSQCKGRARADIELRIAEADLADDKARDSAIGDWKAKADAMDETCRVLGVDSYNLAADAARPLVDEHCELKELREAGRIVPEGVSWPRYEDGEPVRMGDPFVTWDGQASEVRSVTLYTPGPDAAWAINAGSCRNFVGGSDEAHRMHGLRLKRPAPKAVGADGVEVKPGETVWLAREHLDKADMSPSDSGFECGLLGVGALDPLSVKLVGKKLGKDGLAFFTEHSAWCPASWLTHECPDSWGRLREDALKTFYAYWGCEGMTCTLCPAKIGDERPCDHYGTGTSCTDAIHLDIVARAERLAGVRGDE